MMRTGTVLPLFLLALTTGGAAQAQQWNPQPGWKDSYAVDGRCYCDSGNFDHGIGGKRVETPVGTRSVREVCADIERVLGEGPRDGRVPYNDIQCGNGPANDAPDERGCPGRVDLGPNGCDARGPTWDLAAVYGKAPASASGDESGSCTAVGDGLGAAREAFASACAGVRREDCDPLGDGRWLCSSENISALTPLPAPSAPSPAPAASPPAPPAPAAAGGSCSATAVGLGAARDAFAASCPGVPRTDCDPLGDGRWRCSSEVIGAAAPGVPAGPGAAPAPAPTPAPTPATAPPPEVVPTPAPVASPGGVDRRVGRLAAGDLLALHFDNCPDRDDGHAMVADKAVLAATGIDDVIVVNGTCGDAVRGRYQRSSEALARTVFGRVVDAFGGGAAAVNEVAAAWAATLANGGDVWVAEGGPSDFTARVLERLRSAFPSVDRRRVHVVQHSTGSGFNERQTRPANLALVKRSTDYVAIPNGNVAGNGSADLNERSAFFVRTARASRFATEWNAAFAYMNPEGRLDFSDAVELLYIVGDGATRTVDDFARRYLR